MDEGNNPRNVIKNVLYFSTEFIVIKQHANTLHLEINKRFKGSNDHLNMIMFS